MNLRSIRAQLGVVFLGFVALVVSAALVNSWLVQTQRYDGAVINLAGRQRMLTQQMVRLALIDPGDPLLAETAALFQQNTAALRDGGPALSAENQILNLPPTDQADLLANLDAVATAWTPFQASLNPPVDSDILQSEAASLLSELDGLVQAYEVQARNKIIRIQWIQGVYLVTALSLLAWGYFIIRRGLIQPLKVLGAAVRDIGAGHLSAPVPPLADPEFGHLAHTLEIMRTEIAAHQINLEQEVTRRTGELTAAFEFSQEVVRQLEPAQLLQSVANRARELMGGAAASVCVLEDQGQTLELTAGSGVGKDSLGLRQSTEHGLALPVIKEHKTVITEGGCANCGFLHQFPGTSCIAAPLQIGGRSLGALCVVRPQQAFDPSEARILTLLANAAAVGLENTRLFMESRRYAENNAALAERERLAAELHDNLAQTLSAISLKADVLRQDIASGQNTTAATHLEQMREHLKQAYGQVRLALTGLRDAPSQELEIVPELQGSLAIFREQTGLITEFTLGEESSIPLGAVTHKQVLHIVQEALNNIRRHAQATHVRLSITKVGGTVQIEVSDDGIGFNPAQVDSRIHLGLSIMRARAKRSRGKLLVQSEPGLGTCVTAVFPLQMTDQPVGDSSSRVELN